MRNFTVRKTFSLVFCWALVAALMMTFHERFLNKKPVKKIATTAAPLEDALVTDSPPRKKLDFVKTPFVFNSSCEKVCKTKNWTMVIFVKSSTDHNGRRNLIRNSWGALKHLNGGEFRTVFIVGKSNKDNEARLEDESYLYKDILQINYKDTYRHLVLKTLASLQWAIENLQDGDFFSTADDDVLINPLLLKKAVEYYKRLYSFTTMPIVCMYSLWTYRGVPDRDPRSKYYVTWEQYNETTWPRFCPGGMYTVSIDTARKLYEMSKLVPLLPVDDVWLTGLIRQRIYYPDTMVVVARPRAVVHFQGFYLKMNKKKYKQDWGNISVEIAKKADCYCY